MKDFEKQLLDYRLTTAEILYFMPDHPLLLQTYIWQELDLLPNFPTLSKFLNFWKDHLDGKLHSVTIANVKLIQPAELRHFAHGFQLN